MVNSLQARPSRRSRPVRYECRYRCRAGHRRSPTPPTTRSSSSARATLSSRRRHRDRSRGPSECVRSGERAEIETCLTPVVSRAVWSWRRIFENAAFTNQIVEISGAVRLKRVMETFNDFAGNFAVDVHFLTSLSYVATGWPQVPQSRPGTPRHYRHPRQRPLDPDQPGRPGDLTLFGRHPRARISPFFARKAEWTSRKRNAPGVPTHRGGVHSGGLGPGASRGCGAGEIGEVPRLAADGLLNTIRELGVAAV